MRERERVTQRAVLGFIFGLLYYVEQVGPPGAAAVVELEALLGIERPGAEVLGQTGADHEQEHVGRREAPDAVHIVLDHEADAQLPLLGLLEEHVGGEQAAEQEKAVHGEERVRDEQKRESLQPRRHQYRVLYNRVIT